MLAMQETAEEVCAILEQYRPRLLEILRRRIDPALGPRVERG